MLLKINPNVENQPTNHWIYNVLKLNILEFVLPPGQKLSEPQLAKLFSVSRTPIREALALLEAEELIVVIPQSGTFVTKISMKKVYDDLFFRRALEEKILQEAFKINQNFNLTQLNKILKEQINCTQTVKADTVLFHQLDNLFHRTIFGLLGKESIWDKLQFNISTHERIRCIELIEKEKMLIIINQHQEEIKMIQNKEFKNISHFLEKHTENFKNSLSELIEKYPNFFIN